MEGPCVVAIDVSIEGAFTNLAAFDASSWQVRRWVEDDNNLVDNNHACTRARFSQV